MKDDELRRGDYVLFYDEHKLGKIAKVDQVLRYSCLLLYNKISSDNSWSDETIVNYENIHPLPLTYQILERLGFSDCGNTYRYEIWNEEHTAIIDAVCLEKSNTQVDTYLFKKAKIQYVHEFQNILKDFKINKPIIEL